jgi:hypothetical protein
LNQLFYLDDLEIDEPAGFADIELSIKRDELFHGMSYEASTNTMQFRGTAADYLETKYLNEGVKANVIFSALSACDGYDYEQLLSGRLNFGKYKKVCGTECYISLPVEQDSCELIFNARKDQSVDVDKQLGVDNTTILANYPGLSVSTELPTKELFVGIDANVSPGGYEINTGETGPFVSVTFAFRPLYMVKRNDSIDTGNVDDGTFMAAVPGVGGLTDAISPQLLFEDLIQCFVDEFEYTFRLKGNFTSIDTGLMSNGNKYKIYLMKGEWPDPLNTTIIHSVDLPVDYFLYGNYQATFDQTFTGSTTLADGQGLYMLLQFEMAGVAAGPDNNIQVIFDTESSVLVTAIKRCPATPSELYLVHETLSRVSESITNGCVRAKSEFYGRTDSEPFSFDADGCGGLRALTSGLKIRQAVEDKFFVSMKDLLEGLRAIDNIGFDIIQDPVLSFGKLLRVEGVDFFYQDTEILRHDGIPKADIEVEENKHYSRIQVGYKKWEVERVNGLDEFNSNREYNTSIDTINSNLDITSVFIAGSYPIEITRQQSFADSGGADTKYDNETFIICLERTSYPYGSIQVEQGNITNPQNIFSPNTIYNYRLSPLRNLMRWYKTIAAGFASIADAINMLFFSSGTGNLTASGIMTDTFCREENSDIQENQNIFVTKFTNNDYTPLWKNELITYEYPMSVSDYNTIKQNPYGFISAQCGNGPFLKYWIVDIKYRPNKGTATIVGRRKYA